MKIHFSSWGSDREFQERSTVLNTEVGMQKHHWGWLALQWKSSVPSSPGKCCCVRWNQLSTLMVVPLGDVSSLFFCIMWNFHWQMWPLHLGQKCGKMKGSLIISTSLKQRHHEKWRKDRAISSAWLWSCNWKKTAHTEKFCCLMRSHY